MESAKSLVSGAREIFVDFTERAVDRHYRAIRQVPDQTVRARLLERLHERNKWFRDGGYAHFEELAGDLMQIEKMRTE